MFLHFLLRLCCSSFLKGNHLHCIVWHLFPSWLAAFRYTRNILTELKRKNCKILTIVTSWGSYFGPDHKPFSLVGHIGICSCLDDRELSENSRFYVIAKEFDIKLYVAALNVVLIWSQISLIHVRTIDMKEIVIFNCCNSNYHCMSSCSNDNYSIIAVLLLLSIDNQYNIYLCNRKWSVAARKRNFEIVIWPFTIQLYTKHQTSSDMCFQTLLFAYIQHCNFMI